LEFRAIVVAGATSVVATAVRKAQRASLRGVTTVASRITAALNEGTGIQSSGAFVANGLDHVDVVASIALRSDVAIVRAVGTVAVDDIHATFTPDSADIPVVVALAGKVARAIIVAVLRTEVLTITLISRSEAVGADERGAPVGVRSEGICRQANGA